MIRQANKRLDKNIQQGGCLLLCMIYNSIKANNGCSDHIDEWVVNAMYYEGVKRECLDTEAYVLNHDEVCKLIRDYFDLDKRLKIKTLTNSIGFLGEKLQPDTYAICRWTWENQERKQYHFTVIGSNDKMLYNPIPKSSTVKYGHRDGLRIYEVAHND